LESGNTVATKTQKHKKSVKNLVIVESPAKAKTLKKFLGDRYKIEASMGHVRDLPKSQLGVEVESDFEPKYITIRGKGDILKKLRKDAKDAGVVYLATDPDREGEAISWHLIHSLGLEGKKYKRIVFNEVTKAAVKKSIEEARDIDMNLVDSQQARRALDRIVGYKLSPLLWKKVRRRLSAGRVQSVTLRLICDREAEINEFTPVEYWTVDAAVATKGKKKFTAHYHSAEAINNSDESAKICKALEKTTPIVSEVKHGTRQKKPPAPFTTSTMQQEASKALNFSIVKTMNIAQQLYEGVDIKGAGTVGLVSYIRTDSARISDDAFAMARDFVTENHGKEYAAETKPVHKAKGRTQDAHEAIRPTDVRLVPDEMKSSLSTDQYKLYNLIWERFLASCMTAAKYNTTSVKIDCGEHLLRASGQVLVFPGYKKVYKKETEDKEADTLMPELNKGDRLEFLEITPLQHFTQPPPRFSEASLVRTLEENGVGRPSTYSPTITTLISRGYVTKEKNILHPAETGEVVNDILEAHFSDVVDIEFTSKMENGLDKIEFGEMHWKELLREFYSPFNEKVLLAEENIGEVDIKDEETDIPCKICGRLMVVKYGRFGKFLACPGFPECKNALPYYPEAGVNCPACDAKVLEKNTKKGRKYFGCERHPDCDFMSWQKPTGEKCPVCGDVLVEKNTKTRQRVACANGQCGFVEEEDKDE
jgi:DNA topoisomerase-1